MRMVHDSDRYGTLRLFVRVGVLRSFTAAAHEAAMAQSTVSRRIQLLESGLGIQLFQRTTRTVRLTADGERYLARIRAALDALDAADDEVRQGGALRGTLRVTAPTGFGHRRVAPVVEAYLAQHAGVSVELTLTDRYVGLTEESYDLAIRLGALDDSSLRRIALGRFHRLVVASPALIDRVGPIDSPEQLSGHECLIYTSLADVRRWVLHDGGAERSVPVRGRLRSNHLPTLHQAALRGAGFAALPSWLVTESLRRGRLVRVLPQWTAGTVPIHAILPPGRHVPARVKRFLELLRQAAGA